MGSETVSSSVYHGECDSIRAKEEPPMSIKISASRSIGNKKVGGPGSGQQPSTDALVGHSLGDRPLLADDELDEEDGGSACNRTVPPSGAPRSSARSSRLPSVPLPFR